MQEKIRELLFRYIYRKPKNDNYTILCNNCVGAMILHDYRQRFNTPTVNLYLKASDYIWFLKNLKNINYKNLIEVSNDKYPIGLLEGKIEIHFLHYKTFKEAKEKWINRFKRINYDNLYVIFVERDNCSLEILQEFDNLTYKNKIALTHLWYKQISCGYKIPGFENEKELGDVTRFIGKFGKRIYDNFDWCSFLSK